MTRRFPPFPDVPPLRAALPALAIAAAFALSGCAPNKTAVIAATGTTIGVELSQSQTTQAPMGVLGYKRAEFAYVPTNVESTHGGGARDSANVLMELRYKGIFSFQSDSGIYQRLAVGDIAVAQPGAQIMFAKDDGGTVDEDAAGYLAAAEKEISIEEIRIHRIVEYVANDDGSIDAAKRDGLLTTAAGKYPNIVTATVSARIKGAKSGRELAVLLSDDADRAVDPLYQSLPNKLKK
jgi:hypothetical protein